MSYLPPSDYLGFDLSPKYIELAKRRFPKAHFVCERVSQFSLAKEQSFDLVLALGIVHHLEDAEALQLFQIAYDALKPGGKLVTIDGVLDRRSVPHCAVVVGKRPGRIRKERARVRGNRVSGIQQYQTKRPSRSLAYSVHTSDSGMYPVMGSTAPEQEQDHQRVSDEIPAESRSGTDGFGSRSAGLRVACIASRYRLPSPVPEQAFPYRRSVVSHDGAADRQAPGASDGFRNLLERRA